MVSDHNQLYHLIDIPFSDLKFDDDSWFRIFG